MNEINVGVVYCPLGNKIPKLKKVSNIIERDTEFEMMYSSNYSTKFVSPNRKNKLHICFDGIISFYKLVNIEDLDLSMLKLTSKEGFKFAKMLGVDYREEIELILQGENIKNVLEKNPNILKDFGEFLFGNFVLKQSELTDDYARISLERKEKLLSLA